MKIAQVAPLIESVPPKYYGGTERIVSYLTEELVKMGHDVTLYASGDSETSAKLRPMCHRALRLDKHSKDPVADHIYMSERVFQESHEYDIVHSSIDYVPFPLLRRMAVPNVTTLHGRLDIPNLFNLYQEFDDIPLISISNYQRVPLSWANWVATVYHGIPEDLYKYNENPGKYVAFIGRISPEKRVDTAIRIARSAKVPLKIAAKVDKIDKDYFGSVIEPMLSGPDIEYIGEIGESEKGEFLGNAMALIFPIDWPEPFGLVMIEAMACGTPIITRPHGAIPEVIDHGTTGFVFKDMKEAVQAVKDIPKIARRTCREVFEKRFTSKIMANNYVKVYEKLIAQSKKSAGKETLIKV